MKAQIILTSSESKRLIAKGVVALDVVKKALENGWVVVSVGTTSMFVLKEVLGEDFSEEIKNLTVCGAITPQKACIVSEMMDFMVKHNHAKVWILEKGKLQDRFTLQEVLRKMGKDDVFIKGANALDPQGKAAVFLGATSGGTIGVTYGAIKAKGINLIIPVGFEKMIPVSVYEAAKETGIETVDYSMGLRFGMLPVGGFVVTEQTAIKVLTGADVIPLGCGGINGAEGSTILLVKGQDEQVKNTLKIIQEIKGEKPVEFKFPDCSECPLKKLKISKCW